MGQLFSVEHGRHVSAQFVSRIGWLCAVSFVGLVAFSAHACCEACQVQPGKPSVAEPPSATGKAEPTPATPAPSAGNGSPSSPVQETSGLTYSDPVSAKWKVGVRILAGATDAHNIYIAIPVPCDWPEQTVTIEEEELPPSIGNVTYASLDGGVRRQLIKIPVLKAREQLELTTIFRVSTSQINGPTSTSAFVKPESKDKANSPFLLKSRYITFENSKLREQAATLAASQVEPWKQVEAVYDWVRNNIAQKEMPNTDTVKAFRKKEGSEEDKVALFVAMCRTIKFPARMVWVDGGCYAEFMLIDASGQKHWFPCNVTGLREFGSISEPRIILQKGDAIKMPEKPDRQKFVAEHMSCQGASRPVVEFVRELLPDE